LQWTGVGKFSVKNVLMKMSLTDRPTFQLFQSVKHQIVAAIIVKSTEIANYEYASEKKNQKIQTICLTRFQNEYVSIF
jgi:hypothetical protein